MEKEKLLAEWKKINYGFKANKVKPEKFIPNMCELFKKIQSGEIKV